MVPRPNVARFQSREHSVGQWLTWRQGSREKVQDSLKIMIRLISHGGFFVVLSL